MKPRRVWTILHCEVQLFEGGSSVDEVVMFTSSSMRNALAMIRSAWVDAGTWWRVETAVLDDLRGTDTASVLYSRQGRRLRRAPVARGYRTAVARYRKNLRSLIARVAELRRGRGERKLLRVLTRTAGAMKVVLRSQPR